MIVALEGVPAAGKSSVGGYLADHFGWSCIEEVIKLFARPENETYDWYFERQLDRLERAKLESETTQHVVFAGDPYQPIWFDWFYPEMGFASWEYVLEFFESHIPQSYLPDFYGFLTATDEELLRRQIQREADRGNSSAKAEAKYARYAPLVDPLAKLFTALGDEFPGFVLQVEPGEVDEMAQAIIGHEYQTPDTSDFFTFIRQWLSSHEPANFK